MALQAQWVLRFSNIIPETLVGPPSPVLDYFLNYKINITELEVVKRTGLVYFGATCSWENHLIFMLFDFSIHEQG